MKKLKNLPNCTIWDSWIFEKFILADEPFARALRVFETCVLINTNLSEKLVSMLKLPTTFDESFRVTSVQLLYHWFSLIKLRIRQF